MCFKSRNQNLESFLVSNNLCKNALKIITSVYPPHSKIPEKKYFGSLFPIFRSPFLPRATFKRKYFA